MTSSAFIFDLFFFILVGNQDMDKILDKFEFLSDPITDYGVSCPLASEKYSAPRFSQPFHFIKFLYYLQIIRTGIIS